MNKQELNRRLEEHKCWIASDGTEGERLNLDGESLSGLSLRGACLERSSLRNADFYQADLSNASLWGANLHNCDLCQAILTGASLQHASLRNMKLQRTDLSMTDMRGADLFRTDLRRAYLQNAHLPEMTWVIFGEQYDLQITNGILLRVGCQEHLIEDWRRFSNTDLRAMDGDKAIQFYPRLLDILDSHLGIDIRPEWVGFIPA